MELNKVMLIGNLIRDPETRHTQSGKQVTKFRLAVNTRRGRDNDETLYIDVDTWEKTAELVDRYLKKGSQCLVEGRLKLDEYETREGQKRSDIRVVADRVQFGARPRDGADGGDRDERPSREPARDRDEPRQASQARESQSSSYDDGGQTDDDLPF